MKHTYLIVALLVFSGLRAQEKFSVYFDTDRDMPNTDSTEKLEKWLRDNKDADVSKLYAYADSVGKPDYNFNLSKRRLVNINDLIVKGGVVYKQITARAFGEEQSFTGAQEEHRRVDIYYTKAEPKPEPKPDPVNELQQAVAVAKKGDKLKLPNLNFYGNSGQVLPASEYVLKELLTIMQNNEKLVIEIQGHICCLSVDREDVSGKRARAVYDYLVKNKISPKRLSYKAFGGSRPLKPMPEMTEGDRVANRRVEIEIIEN